jgi:predicted ABC-type ATPase
MKLLILNGGSCSGKSSVIKYIMKKRKHLFHLGYDSLKWSFSDYTSEKYYKDVQKIILVVADAIFKMNYDVISDSTLYAKSRKELINLATLAGYQILEVNLEAEPEVLAKRFDERVASALATPERKISNLSKDRFQELLNIFEREKNPQAISIKTDTQTVEDVAENILKFF